MDITSEHEKILVTNSSTFHVYNLKNNFSQMSYVFQTLVVYTLPKLRYSLY